MRGNLLRAVSHDIRTPLTSIVGAASGIIENHQVLTEEQTLELVEDIRQEAQWLIRIVENLLSITTATGESGSFKAAEISYPTIDVNSINDSNTYSVTVDEIVKSVNDGSMISRPF